MIYKNNTDASVERHKARLNLTGDVYMVGNYMESLESHKRLMPTSTATTIEEAEQERIEHEAELERKRQEAALLAEEAENGEPE